jgi:hypothetical protein
VTDGDRLVTVSLLVTGDTAPVGGVSLSPDTKGTTPASATGRRTGYPYPTPLGRFCDAKRNDSVHCTVRLA